MAEEPVAVGVAAGVMGSAGAAGVAEVVGLAGGEGVWRGSSLQAAASTERHSVRASVAEQTPNKCDSVADLFGARRWISGFSGRIGQHM